MPSECFEIIFDALRDSFELSSDAEITVECNPASITKEGLSELLELGVDRLSIGLQSADDRELALLGRLHTFEGFCRTYDDARRVGFDNVSVDLMYGIPAQTRESFALTLQRVISLDPEHISAYGLKIEKGTPFYQTAKSLSLPDEDTEVELYELCCDTLLKNGYRRYEISNFAKAGRESRHNLKYWRLDDYIGFGVSAHSCFAGERFGNSRDIKSFLLGKDICEQRQKISRNDTISEYVMLGLRLEEGVDMREYFALTGKGFKESYPSVESYIKNGFMTEHGERIAFSTKGFFVSNAILSEMLDFEE